MEERCPTGLLADIPAETDAFGGHARVARSIVEVVQTESGGKTIGLEGGWGAGKSTVVNLISQELTQTNQSDQRVAVFDMWSHQDDPLRRTFLENLIACVQGFGWVNEEKWERRTDELARRRREDTTKIVPQLTSAGIFFAFTLLLIPIGSVLISAGLLLLGYKDASEAWGRVILPLGIFLVLGPAIYYCCLNGKRCWRRRFRTGGDEDDGGLNDLPALLTRQATTESRTVVTQTPDPTSVEFETMFRELLDDALKPAKRKLLLVVDNLDRVEPSDALSIWSTMQTFLGHTDYQRPDWIGRLWVLIPYDGNAILRLWSDSDSDATKPADASMATSFMDKTFQLRFKVPPLLLSNWREFLQEALQRVLPSHQEADFHGVYRAFAAKGGLEESAPTPRDLKIFVNQIGSLHRQWQDEFPLSYLACYVLFQKDCKDVRKALLARDHSDLPRRIIGKEWREVVAALEFGVPVNDANQLLLRGPIQIALANGDGSALSEIASTYPAGFWSVLEDSVPVGARDWNELSPAELAKAATAIAHSRILDSSDGRPEAATLLSTVRTAASSVRAWNPFDSTTATGIIALGQLVGDTQETVSALIAGVSNARVDAPDGEQQENADESVSPGVWMDSAITVIKGLVGIGLGERVSHGIKVPLNAEQWLDVSLEVAGKDPEGQVLQYLELRAVDTIDDLLNQKIASNQMDEKTFNAVYNAMATKSRNTMTSVAEQVFSRLQSGESFHGDAITHLLRTLRISNVAGLIDQGQYTEFAENGHYLHHLHRAVTESHAEAVAKCMFGYLEAVPDGSEPNHVGNSAAGYQNLTELLENPDVVPGTVESFTALAKESQQLSVIFEMAARDGPVHPFVARVLNALLISEDISKPIELVRSNWEVIEEVLDEDEESAESLETFLRGLPGRERLVASVMDDAFDAYDSGLCVALLRSISSPDFMAWCATGLSSVNLDAWVTDIKSQGNLVELVIELRELGATISLGSTYLDALTEYAKSVVSGVREVLPRNTWNALFSLLSADQQEMFSRRAYEILQDSDGEANGQFFDLFGPTLSSPDLLAHDQRLIDRVCRPILDEGNDKGIAWVAAIAESNPKLLTEHSDRAAVNDFVDRVQKRLNDTPEDAPILSDVIKIGTVLGVQRIEREDSETDSGALSEEAEESSD